MFELLAVVGVPLLMLFLIRKLDGSASRQGGSRGFVGWLREVKLWHVATAIALTALAFATLNNQQGLLDGPFFFLSVLIGLFLIARAWRHEFVFLMSLRDDELPGRNDKLVWTALMILLPPVGLWAFRAFRESRWPEPAPEPAQA